MALAACFWHKARMKPISLAIALVVSLPLSANAQQSMDAAEFDAYATGKTLYYADEGGRYGAEEYLPNHRVRWSFLDGQCKDGQWYQDGQMICFTYEDDPEPQCWSFYKRGGGVVALFENDPEQTTLFEVQQSDKPMMCLGPDIGV